MERRKLGRTSLDVSLLGFGCGAVGGLMVKGAAADQERAVARAVELGINYFDTAQMYGNGESERNLGRVLKALKPDVYVGTKVRLPPTERGKIGQAIVASLDASLKRLQRDAVDLFQFHNAVVGTTKGAEFGVDAVLEEVVPAFQRLRDQGKFRFFGITANGETAALLRVIDARAFDTGQASYNLLNPSPGAPVPPNYPAQDYENLLGHAQAAGMGIINIRVLAGGALSGTEERHPNASPPPDPIGSGSTYRADLERARRLMPLVQEGHAESLVDASLRYVIAHQAVSTVLIGIATVEQFETAARAINKGPLSPPALARAAEIQRGFAGEPR
ncbi:MAG: aldo/keto reductase [Alphaproteobacteria bacterium]|nr:aldo/keto reductase [Alphaproteobacteria bacterium]MBV9585258.1 aldo/keto reductase [Alphaproteobacteria bacterium]MBV9965793.1 aldo/keto reductase [Alphaproteobacteria bacterium]